MSTGQTIKKLREQAGLSQSRLADALYVSRDLVSKWETGRRLPEYGVVLKMAELFSVDPEVLLKRDALLTAELSSLLPDGYPPDGAQLKQDLNAFLGTLNVRDRSVFIRRYYFLDDPSEIGEAYGIKPNYVRTILARVRKKLKRYLKEKSI